MAVTLSLAADHASLPIAHRLYLPQTWANDPARRARAGVPDEVVFQTKPQIALAQISAAIAVGVPPATVLAVAGFGIDTALQDGITELGLTYVVGIQSHTSLWPPGIKPLPPKPWSPSQDVATGAVTAGRGANANEPFFACKLLDTVPLPFADDLR